MVDHTYIGTTNYGAHWLEPLAAASWFRMVRDGCPPAGITDAGRTQQEQIDVFLRYFTTDLASSAHFDLRIWEGRTYWRRPGKPSAATPGSLQARHTFGRALDLNGATRDWVRANGYRYGWIKDLVPGELWHQEYQPGRDVTLTATVIVVHPPVPVVPVVVPLPPDLEGVSPLMRLIKIRQTQDVILVGPTLFQHVKDMATVNSLVAIYGNFVELDATDGERIKEQVIANIVATAENLKGQGV